MLECMWKTDSMNTLVAAMLHNILDNMGKWCSHSRTITVWIPSLNRRILVVPLIEDVMNMSTLVVATSVTLLPVIKHLPLFSGPSSFWLHGAARKLKTHTPCWKWSLPLSRAFPEMSYGTLREPQPTWSAARDDPSKCRRRCYDKQMLFSSTCRYTVSWRVMWAQ